MNRNIEEQPVRFGKSRLIKISETHSGADGGGVLLDDPATLHPERIINRGHGRYGGHTG